MKTQKYLFYFSKKNNRLLKVSQLLVPWEVNCKYDTGISELFSVKNKEYLGIMEIILLTLGIF